MVKDDKADQALSQMLAKSKKAVSSGAVGKQLQKQGITIKRVVSPYQRPAGPKKGGSFSSAPPPPSEEATSGRWTHDQFSKSNNIKGGNMAFRLNKNQHLKSDERVRGDLFPDSSNGSGFKSDSPLSRNNESMKSELFPTTSTKPAGGMVSSTLSSSGKPLITTSNQPALSDEEFRNMRQEERAREERERRIAQQEVERERRLLAEEGGAMDVEGGSGGKISASGKGRLRDAVRGATVGSRAPRAQQAPTPAPPAVTPAPTAAFAIKGKSTGETAVMVAGLAEGTTAEDVKATFRQFGHVTTASIYTPATPPRGATVSVLLTFSLRQAADEACQTFNGAVADGLPLKVEVWEPFAAVSSPSLAPAIAAPAPTGPRQSAPLRHQQHTREQQQQRSGGSSNLKSRLQNGGRGERGGRGGRADLFPDDGMLVD